MLTISRSSQYAAPYQQKKAEKKIGFGDIRVEIKDSSLHIHDYDNNSKAIVNNLQQRLATPTDRKGQFLDWITVLPQIQIKNLKPIYEMAQSVPQPGAIKDLVIVGIGGSRHTTEALVDLVNPQKGKGSDHPKKVNVHFYSATDSDSLDRLKQKIDPKKTLVVVVSKSGTTKETELGYYKLRELIEGAVGDKVNSRFVAMTDANAAKSKLRREEIDLNKRIPVHGLVHDDVGGRFSMFDDATLFTLAYLGMPKKDMKAMLKGALESEKKYMNPNPAENTAMQRAIFAVHEKNSGKQYHHTGVFGGVLNGEHDGYKYWKGQMEGESVKGFGGRESTGPNDKYMVSIVNKGSEFLHFDTETHLSPGVESKFAHTIINTTPKKDDTIFKTIVNDTVNIYSEQNRPLAHVTVSSLTAPKDIGEFITHEHFTTLYTKMLDDQMTGHLPDKKTPLSAVLQPSVEMYKAKVRAAAEGK